MTAPPPAPRRPRRGAGAVAFLVALAAGALLTAAYPPLAWWPVAWVALAPLYVVLTSGGVSGSGDRPARPWAAFGRGYGFGWSLFLLGMDWMGQLGAVPWIVLTFIEATWFGLFGMFAAVMTARLPRAWQRVLVFAALWTVVEYARHVGAYAFPWFVLAATQVRVPLLLQIVSDTGQWGLSFAIALTGALLGEAWRAARSRDRRGVALRAAGASAVPLALAAYGVAVFVAQIDAPTGSGPVLAAAQGSVPKPSGFTDSDEYRATAMEIYASLSRDAARAIDPADVVIWPETVVPGYLFRDPVLDRRVSDLARETRTALLVGTVDIDPADRELNSSALYAPAGELAGRYDKKQVVPLGEFFPLRALLGSVYRTYGVDDRDMVAGTLPGTLTIPAAHHAPFRLGVLICYDDVFPVQARDRVNEGAQALSVQTSDQTFGTSSGPVQHADLAILRAVETRRWLIRSAATGVSMVVSPMGDVVSSLGTDRRGVLARRVPLRTDRTPFVRFGDWWVWVCAAVLVWAGWRSRRPLPPALVDPHPPSPSP